MSGIKQVAIVGCGYWGRKYLRILESKNCSVSWCCDLDLNTLDFVKQYKPSINVTTDYRKIVNNGDIEAVVISTPASTHYQIAKESLENGKHVLIEKPMTTSSVAAEEICDLASKLGVTLMVGHVYLYHPAIQKIKSMISAGDLGDIYHMSFIRAGLGPIRNDVNVMWDLAPHDISICHYLLGEEPIDIKANGASFLKIDMEDIVVLNLRFASGKFATIHSSWLDPIKTRIMRIVGSKKMLLFDDTASMEMIRVYDKGVMLSNGNETGYGEFRLTLREGDVYSPRIEPKEPLKVMCEHFLDCIRNGKKPITDGLNGLAVVKALEKADSSLKAGKSYNS